MDVKDQSTDSSLGVISGSRREGMVTVSKGIRAIIKVTSVDNRFLISLEPLRRGQNTFLKEGSLEQLFSIIQVLSRGITSPISKLSLRWAKCTFKAVRERPEAEVGRMISEHLR